MYNVHEIMINSYFNKKPAHAALLGCAANDEILKTSCNTSTYVTGVKIRPMLQFNDNNVKMWFCES